MLLQEAEEEVENINTAQSSWTARVADPATLAEVKAMWLSGGLVSKENRNMKKLSLPSANGDVKEALIPVLEAHSFIGLNSSSTQYPASLVSPTFCPLPFFL